MNNHSVPHSTNQTFEPPKAFNPLTKHFRQPAIHISLVSNGKWWDGDALFLPPNGEIPVLPITTKDEILLKTPDGLMNGSSVVEVIQSCCPNIKNAWEMPSIDVDKVLIAIRIASYGHTMDVSGECPHCKEKNEYAINLHSIIDSIKCPDFDTPVHVDGLEIYLKPQKYFISDKSNQIEFQQQQALRQLSDPNLPDLTKRTIIADSMKVLTDWGLETLAESTQCIVMEDGTVVDSKEFILEYYTNASGYAVSQVKDHIRKLADVVNIKPVDVNCENDECQKPYKISLDFNYSSFFANGF